MNRTYAFFNGILALALAVGCGAIKDPDGNNGEGDGGANIDASTGNADAPTGASASIRGTVWAPGQAPGQVPTGHEIPIFNAFVTLTYMPLDPIPQETFCERCVEPSGIYTFTDHRGQFTLASVPPGIYWLTIQKAQFRLQRQIALAANQILDLSSDATTLPSQHDPVNGQWIPRIAIAVGNRDHLEDILGKMHLGGVDDSGDFIDSSASGVMDVYTNGTSFGGVQAGTLTDLVGDLNKMLQYHIIFIPCSVSNHTDALDNQENLRNIRDFVDAGGKLYVTDWSGEWQDNVFPAQITLGGGVDTPASAYDPDTDSWNTGQFGNADGKPYDSNNAEVVDNDLYQWLSIQRGPTVEDDDATESFTPGEFTVEGNWNVISALDMVYMGDDDDGNAVYDVPKEYVIGGMGTSTPQEPLTVTYQPTGCGRVLYSTYHTTDNTHNGLVPQERVLLYLIMEIGVCQSGPIIE